MNGRPLRAAWLLALALACAAPREPGAPAPAAVNPPRGSADAPVRVEISGRGLSPRANVDLSATGGAGLDAGFRAWLEPDGAGSAAALGDVALTPRRTLLATVPAGLAPGAYRLVVAGPDGRTGALEQGYRVVSSARAVARFEVALGAAPRAGIKFPVEVAALDAAGAVVDGFEGTVILADAAGALAPRPHGPFARGRAGGRVAIEKRLASDVLTVADGAGHAGTSPPFSVEGGPPMALVFASAPVTVAAGRCSPAVELALQDGTGAPTAAASAITVELRSAPPGLAFHSGPGCTEEVTAVEIPAGAGGAAFHFRAAAPGAVTLRASPAALPSATQGGTVTP